MKLYSAYDVKANEYYSPFEAAHDIAAQREIQKSMSQNPTMNRFVLHRDEFVLVRLADFDTVSGSFEQVGPAPVITFSALFADLQNKLSKDVPNANPQA